MATQRQFHAAVQEVPGERMMTIPGAALEMVPLMRPDEPDRGRATVEREIARREARGAGRHGRDNVLNAQAQRWWLDEWARPDGLYGLRELTAHEMDRCDELIERIPLKGFTGASSRDELASLPDAQIVCETLAIDAMLLLTHDPRTLRSERLLPWTTALAEASTRRHSAGGSTNGHAQTGLYGLRELTAHEMDRCDELIERIPLKGFTGASSRDELASLPDAQIVCETLAIDAMLLLTHDPRTLRSERLLPWTTALAEASWVSRPEVVCEADEVNHTRIKTHPEDMLLATIVCAWPQASEAGPQEVTGRIEELLERLPFAGLEKTAKGLSELMRLTNRLPELIERTAEELPVQMRNAERRSPYRSFEGPQERPRTAQFALRWSEGRMALIHRSLNGNEHQWGAWSREQFDAMEKFLAERGIDVGGLPEPRTGGGSGFARAIRTAVDELARGRGQQ